MKPNFLRVGIVGIGTIGQANAQALDGGDIAAQLTAITSRNLGKAESFAATLKQPPPVLGLPGVIDTCDLVIETATPSALETIAPLTLKAGKDLMVLSVGGLLDHPEWGDLAAQHGFESVEPRRFSLEDVFVEIIGDRAAPPTARPVEQS